ncbi:MAG: hypothetical protein RR590_05920 [Hungatella sp.]
MKKYGICLLLFLSISVVCLLTGYWVTKSRVSPESAISNTIFETESVTENQAVINQKEIEPRLKTETAAYYLVSETGYLLVFSQDQSTICLYTHIPITDFPEQEQEKLRAGIWFSTMMEIYNYLESYTS